MLNSSSYRVVSRKQRSPATPNDTEVVSLCGVEFGGPRPVVIAGPCAVESRAQTLGIAQAVKNCGADMLRGGAYKPRTSPYDFQGLGEEGLEILESVRGATGLPVVTEVMDPRLVERVGQTADMLQVGSRCMQNFPLLLEVGLSGKPVLLKRGMGSTLYEWLCAAEYIAKNGNTQIVFCERGIRTFAAGEYSRFSLDLNVISALKKETYLPVIVDPSHATGRPEMVLPAARAAIGFGADGLIIEVIAEQTPRSAVQCDADQAVRPSLLRQILEELRLPAGATIPALQESF